MFNKDNYVQLRCKRPDRLLTFIILHVFKSVALVPTLITSDHVRIKRRVKLNHICSDFNDQHLRPPWERITETTIPHFSVILINMAREYGAYYRQ